MRNSSKEENVNDTFCEIKKQGRPKQEITKNNIVTTYLTDPENNKFRENVKKSGLSASAYLRNIILEKYNNG